MRRAILDATLLAAVVATVAQAQTSSPNDYRRVEALDLISGWEAEGSLVQAEGYVGMRDGTLLFLSRPISAQVPLLLITRQLPTDLVARIAGQCAFDPRPDGMCKVTLRGKVMPKRQHSFLADEIELK